MAPYSFLATVQSFCPHRPSLVHEPGRPGAAALPPLYPSSTGPRCGNGIVEGGGSLTLIDPVPEVFTNDRDPRYRCLWPNSEVFELHERTAINQRPRVLWPHRMRLGMVPVLLVSLGKAATPATFN